MVWCSTCGVLEVFRHVNEDIREIKHHVYVKWQTRICTTWPSFLFTYWLLFIISTTKLVVSRNFLFTRIVLSCYYLLIFYLRNSQFKSDVCVCVYVKLKLSINPLSPNSDQQPISPNNIHMLPSEIVMRVNKMIT